MPQCFGPKRWLHTLYTTKTMIKPIKRGHCVNRPLTFDNPIIKFPECEGSMTSSWS